MTRAVETAYNRAQRADDAYQAALDRAGESRYAMTHKSATVRKAKTRKLKADRAYQVAVDKMRAKANPMRKTKRKKTARRKKNPATTLHGWVGARAVKIVKDAKGRAVKVLIKQ